MEGMGTTLTAMLFSGSKMGMVHIGDSRAYLLRDGEFFQVTHDDTYVQMLVDEGRISLEEANIHPQRSLLIRALDGRDADPEYSVRQVEHRRPLPALQRRPVRRGQRRDASRRRCANTSTQPVRRPADRAGAARRRPGQHHGDRRRRHRREHRRGPADRGRRRGQRPRHGHLGRPVDVLGPRGGAGRAAAAGPAGPSVSPTAAAATRTTARRHPLRTVLILVVLLGLLGGGLWYAWSVTQSRFYIGATDDGNVAIFKGVPGKIAWLEPFQGVPEERPAPGRPHAERAGRRQAGHRVRQRGDARRSLATLTDPNSSARKSRCSSSPVGSTNGSPSPPRRAAHRASGSTSPTTPGHRTPRLTPTGPPTACRCR